MIRLSLTRRGFLSTGASALSLLAALGPLPAWSQTEPSANKSFSAGFLGDRSLLIVVEDGVLNLPAPFPVARDAGPDPDPTHRYGGLGRLNGDEVHFSGGRNTTVSRVATPWASREPGSFNPAFAPLDPEARIPADLPEAWEVLLNGRRVAVTAMARKTVPLRGAEVARRTPVHETRHLITLELETPIPPDATVDVRAPLAKPITVQRNATAHSELIHVCQAGYGRDATKRAYVGQWLGHDPQGQAVTTDAALSEDIRWRLVSESDGAEILAGNLVALPPSALKDRPLTGCTMYEADFSDCTIEGRYRLQVEGLGASFPFDIGAQPCRDALRLAARWFYYKRTGIARVEPFAEGYPQPRNGHPEDGLTVWQSDILLQNTSEGFGGPYAVGLMRESPFGDLTPTTDGVPRAGQANPDAWGGWHDAGDWDVRAQHLEVVYTMAWLVETLPSTANLSLNLPESGLPFADPAVLARVDRSDTGDGETVLPDLLHEALWGLSFWRRTQRPDGGIIGGVEFSQVGIKGSYSWDPVERAHAYAPDPWAAYLFAASAAKLGHVIARQIGDLTLGERLIAEALRAWNWAEAQGAAPDVAPLPEVPETTEDGENADGETSEETETVPPEVSRIWRARVAAAAPIYRATGAQDAKEVFESANAYLSPLGKRLNLRPSVYVAQALDYHLAGSEGRPVDPQLRAKIIEWVRNTPERDRRNRLTSEFGLHVTGEYPWGRGWLRFGPGANWPAQRIALALSIMDGKPAHLKRSVTEGMWFALGCNPSNVSLVQGLGTRKFADPLMLDRPFGDPIPGYPAFGAAGGELHPWEKERTQGTIYPASQDDWPLYAQIFETHYVAICAEHGIKSNAMEWLVACAVACELETA